MKIHVFFGIGFCIDFWMHFGWKIAPKWTPKNVGVASFFAPFRRLFSDIDFGMHFGRPLAHFGSLLAPIGFLLAAFSSLFAFF